VDFHARKISLVLHEPDKKGETVTQCKLYELAVVMDKYIITVVERFKKILRDIGYDETLLD